MLKLSRVLSAFLGDAEAGAELMGDALESAIIIMGTAGTRAPVDGACELIGKLTGKSTREKAVQAGWKATGIRVDNKGRASVPGVNVGKMTPENAARVASDVAGAFVLAVSEFLCTPVEKKKADPATIGARALKGLAGLTDSQFAKLIGTTAGADLLARIARVQAVEAVKLASLNTRTRQRAESQPATTDSQPATTDSQPAPVEQPAPAMAD